MPAMPRPANKARKIAYRLIGKPNNIAFDRSPFPKEVQEQLKAEQIRTLR